MKRTQEKIQEIEQYLKELSTIIPQKFKNYKNNIEKKAACERYVEKIVEAVVDLAFIIIKQKKYRIPDDDSDAFTILLENKIINEQLAKQLKNAKGMRNILAHQYGNIDDSIIFEALTNNLEKDVQNLLKSIKEHY